MNKDKSEQQSQQGIIEWENASQWTHYYGAMFECGDYEQLLDDINSLLHQQQAKTRKETLEEAIEAVKNINSLDESIHTYYQSGYELAREKAIEKLQSLINKQ